MTSASTDAEITGKDFKDASLSIMPLLAIVGALLALFFGIHRASLLNYIFPAITSLIAAWLYAKSIASYTQFILTVWFVTPLLRRLIDYNSGWTDPSPVLLAGYLVTLVGPLLSLKLLAAAPFCRTYPFVLAGLGLACGACSGFHSNPPMAVMMGLLNWGCPMALACLISVDVRHVGDYWRGITSSLPLLTTLSAAYTILQFAFVFPWDAFWIVSLNSPSMRSVEAFSIRAFGNLNSPGTAAFVLAAGCLVTLNLKQSWKSLSLVLPVTAMMTTQVRSGWIVLAIGLILSFVRRPGNTVVTLIPVALVAMAATFSGLSGNNKLTAIYDRTETLADVANDSSAASRSDGYRAAWNQITSEPFGHGLGTPEDFFDITGSFSLRDSGVIDLLVSLGWIGGAAYLSGFISTLHLPVLRFRGGECCVQSVSVIVAISLIAVSPLGSMTVALSGVLIWTFAAISRSSPMRLDCNSCQ